MRNILYLIIFLTCISEAQIYKWVDKDGKAHYSDSKTEEQQKELSFDKLNVVGDNQRLRWHTPQANDFHGLWGLNKECREFLAIFDAKIGKYYSVIRNGNQNNDNDILVANTSLRKISKNTYSVGKLSNVFEVRISSDKNILQMRKDKNSPWENNYKCVEPLSDKWLADRIKAEVNK